MDRLSNFQLVRQPLQWLVESWDRFFFQPVDALPLSILRILAGCMLLYTHCVWGSVLTEFLGSDGWNSHDLVSLSREGGFLPSLWWYVPESSMHHVHLLCNAIIVLFILGAGGRVTSILTWAIAISYAHRTSPANFGLDQINCMLTLYLCIGPAMQYLSVDRWLRLKFAKDKQRLDQPSSSANVAMRLIQLHLCVIYLWAGLGKLQGEAWWNGNATWLALANYEYQSMDMTWLAHFPRLLEIITHVTIAWEVSFSFLVWPKRSRWFMLAIGTGMHLGIGMFLGMWTFGSIMIFSYLSFASAEWLRKYWPVRLRSAQLTTSVLALNRDAETNEISESSESESIAAVIDDLRSAVIAEPDPVATSDEVKVEASTVSLASDISPEVYSEIASDASSQTEPKNPSAKTVVLITESPQCVEHFLRLNREAGLNWVVAASIKEAEKLVPLLADATYLYLELRSVGDASELDYVSVRVVRVKRSSRKSANESGESSNRRAFPK